MNNNSKPSSDSYVFFIDLDNTLLRNDQVKIVMKQALNSVLGTVEADHFWRHHDRFRQEKNMVDFPRIIREYCAENHTDTCNITVHTIFDSIDFLSAVYPDAVAVLQHLKTLGKVYIFTQGDSIYQSKKIEKTQLNKIVDGVFLFAHKYDHVNEIISQFPGYIPIFIDDRWDILNLIQKSHPNVITIEVSQGHYATVDHRKHEPVDLKINSIAQLLSYTSFESRSQHSGKKGNLQTYTLPLLCACIALVIGISFWRHISQNQTNSPQSTGVILSGTIDTSKVKTDAQWRKILTPSQYHILREAGTEIPFSGALDYETRKGTYYSVGCSQPVFRSEQKYDSGTGWPSFSAPISTTAIVLRRDITIPGEERIEVLDVCGSHLGHVFDDGPAPTGKRYCMNSLALRFVPDTQ